MFGFGKNKKKAMELCDQGFSVLNSNPQSAKNNFEQAIAENSKCGKAYLGLGIIAEKGLVGAASDEEALELYSNAFDLDYVAGTLYLARVYVRGGPECEDDFLQAFDDAMNYMDETIDEHAEVLKEIADCLASGNGCIEEKYAEDVYEQYRLITDKEYARKMYNEKDHSNDYVELDETYQD